MAPNRLARELFAVAILALLSPVLIPSASAADDTRPGPADIDIAIDSVPTGRQVTLDFNTYTTPFTFTCASGTNRNLFVSSPQTENETRFVFREWSDGYPNDGRNRTIDCDTAPSNSTALFDTEYWMVVTSTPTGRTVVIDGTSFETPATSWCAGGSVVAVVAPSPQDEFLARHTFTNWSDGGAANRTVVCNAPVDLRAVFFTEFLITVFTAPAGLPVGIDGDVSLSPVAFWCTAGEERLVSALARFETEDSTFVFSRWEDGNLDPVRRLICDRPFNITAFYTGISSPGTPEPPLSLPVLGVLVAIAAIGVGIALAVAGRRPAGPPPPAPGRFCTSCRAQAASDWQYCSVCGAELPAAAAGSPSGFRPGPHHAVRESGGSRPPDRP